MRFFSRNHTVYKSYREIAFSGTDSRSWEHNMWDSAMLDPHRPRAAQKLSKWADLRPQSFSWRTTLCDSRWKPWP